MSMSQTTEPSTGVYRVDKFAVPAGAREEFLERVQATHDLLRTLPGFIRDVLLEQAGGPGEFNFVTIAEWDSQESIASARAAVEAMHRKIGFDPQEMVARLSIRKDIADYRRIDSLKPGSVLPSRKASSVSVRS